MNSPDQQTPSSFSWTAAIFWLGGCLLVIAVGLNVLLYFHSDKIFETGHSIETTPVKIRLGRIYLDIPANMLRFANEREGGQLETAHLYLHWPEMTGYSRENSHNFNSIEAAKNLLFITMSNRFTSGTAEQKLNEIYRRFFIGEPRVGPTGLTARTLDPGSGYLEEDVFFEDGRNNPFVARCLSANSVENEGLEKTCLTELNIDDEISVTIRFHNSILAEWPQLVTSTRRLVRSLRN